jgi:hypothetical protein
VLVRTVGWMNQPSTLVVRVQDEADHIPILHVPDSSIVGAMTRPTQQQAVPPECVIRGKSPGIPLYMSCHAIAMLGRCLDKLD